MESWNPVKKGSVRDAGYHFGSARKVEHYEIAGYGTLCTFARQLGHDVAAALLEETMNEERRQIPYYPKLRKPV